MKSYLLTILSSFIVLLTCQAQENIDIENTQTAHETNPKSVGWPEDIDGLIKHLNNWDTEELAAYEQPNAYPKYKTSGETNGWIITHKKLLQAKGVSIKWNKERMLYQINTDQP